jgi:hypothetical protein
MEGSREIGLQQHKRAYELDTNCMSLEYLHDCFATGHYDVAYYYVKKIVEKLKRDNIIPTPFYLC